VKILIRTVVVAALGLGGIVAVSATAQAAGTGSISGTVTDSATGAPVAGISVEVLTKRSNGGQTGPFGIADATTRADGTYTVTGLPPSALTGYWVCFAPNLNDHTTAYTPQCYVNTPGYAVFPDAFGFTDVPPGSTTVTVGIGQHRTGINAQVVNSFVPQPGGVTGTVTEAAVGNKLSNVEVTVFDAANNVAGTGVTSRKGTYEVDGLTSGQSYAVCFTATQAKGGITLHSYQNQCWKKKAWTGAGGPAAGSTAVPIGSGQIVHGINAVIAPTLA
jgi:hypothetical protein